MKKKYINPCCNIYVTKVLDVLSQSNYNSEFEYDDTDWL